MATASFWQTPPDLKGGYLKLLPCNKHDPLAIKKSKNLEAAFYFFAFLAQKKTYLR
jgi:hypothetical protein